jgi:hypothetical protein
MTGLRLPFAISVRTQMAVDYRDDLECTVAKQQSLSFMTCCVRGFNEETRFPVAM